MIKELTCIVCPVGCKLSVTLDSDGKPTDVTGNTCQRGKKFALSELTDPQRTLTSTVKLISKLQPRLPVKTSGTIPKGKLSEAMELLNTLTVKAPIKLGDVILKDFITPGIDLVACKSFDE